MRSVPILLAGVTACLSTAVHTQTLHDVIHPDLQARPFHLQASAARPGTAISGEAGGAASMPLASLPANVTPVPCPEGNSFCGYIQAPLDRKQPHGPKLSIYFEQYFHSKPGPAESAIMVNLGGPGIATTASRDYFQSGLFAANMDTHDLLLVDDRGRGLSSAIDCPELQHGTADFITAEHNCAVQLGNGASRYGTGDVAEDMNDVREALGYEFVDYLGASWGGADAIAFATRFPEHVRSLVLDAPTGPPNVFPYTREQRFRTRAEPEVIDNLCRRSLLCAPDHPHPEEELSDLIERLRAHPLEGDAHDANGKVIYVRLDERALLDFVLRGNFTTANEVLAAGVSLRGGDPGPLLRLAAEGFYTLQPGDSGDPTVFSNGAFYATGCSDVGEPWGWSDSFAARLEDDNELLEGLPPHYFAPFSKSVGADILFSTLGKQCLWWEKPTPSSPIAPHHAVYPSVPTLVLVGDIDDVVPTEASRAVATLFPNSTFVVVANARHETTGWTQCGTNLANHLIATLSPGDTSCANTPEYIWPAVGRFPILARHARPAVPDSSATNRIGEPERKVVSASVAAATDALQRFTIGSGSGVGLRGGTFESSGNFPLFSITLTDCAFTEDVSVEGTISWSAPDGAMTADLTVKGRGTSGGALHITGFWEGLGPVGSFKVTGQLGAKHVAVLVAEG